MHDPDCVQFLQWALPRLRLRWPGFRKVRRQICRRIGRRLTELGLADVAAYRAHLVKRPAEWEELDALCRIFISRFYRDKRVFQFLEREVLPRLAKAVAGEGGTTVRCWSVGCAAGEEPYTLALLWRLGVAPRCPAPALFVLATDADARAIERARRGCYPAGSLKDLPDAWRLEAFHPSADGFYLKSEYREPVAFLQQDVRRALPDERFHLILCRYLVFTYFEEGLQREILGRITARLAAGGGLVTGSLESLPEGEFGLEPWAAPLRVYRKRP